MQSLGRCRAQEHPCRQSPAREAGPALPACWQRLVHLPDWKSRAGKPSDPLPVATPAPAVVTAARQQRGQPLPWSPCCSHAGTQSLGRGSSRQGQRGAATPGMAPSALPALTAAPGSRDLIFTARAGLSAPICVCRGRDASAGLAQAGSSVLARRQPPGRQPLRCCRTSSAALPAPNPCRSQGWVSPGRRGAPRDPVCLAGGQPSALACTFKAKTLSLQPQNCPLFPFHGTTMAAEHVEGGAGGAQCPAELPVPLPNTHVPPADRDVARGGPSLSGYPCPVLGTQHGPSGTRQLPQQSGRAGSPPQLEPWFLLHGTASPPHVTLAPVLHLLPHSLHRSTRLLQPPCAQRSPFSQGTGQGVLPGGSRGERQATRSSATSRQQPYRPRLLED